MDDSLPASARGYLASRRRFRRLLSLAESAFDGFWLGLLDDQALYALDEHYFSGESEYQTEEWNRQGLVDWERRHIERYFPPGGRLLVLAAGGGREVLALERLGYEVDGYEVNPELVAFAEALLREEEASSTVRLSPRDRCPALERRYDGLIVGWGGYMHLPGRSRRVALLRDLRKHAAPGAPLLLSFFHRAMTGRSYRTVATVGNAVRRVLRREPLDLGDGLSPHYAHFFNEASIASELREGGFELVEFSTEDYGQAVGRAV